MPGVTTFPAPPPSQGKGPGNEVELRVCAIVSAIVVSIKPLGHRRTIIFTDIVAQ